MTENHHIVDTLADDKGRWLSFACLLLVLAFVIGIRIRLLAMPLERDEGEYAYIAQMMLKGVPPYLSAYSMKLPGIYAIYAAVITVFGQTCTAIHLGLLIFNAAAIVVVFLLTKRLFDNLAAVIAAAAYAVMSLAWPVLGLSANTEQFLILPALVGVVLLTVPVERRGLPAVFIAALLFGLAFIIKQSSVFFIIFAMLYLLYSDLRCGSGRWKKIVIAQFIFAVGAVIPFAIVCFLLRKAGAFDKFWFWAFTYAGKYATSVTPRQAVENFLRQFHYVFESAIPVWLFALTGMLRILLNVRLRKHLPFIIGLLVFSFLCVCPGFYFREHYFIFILPAVAVAAGAGFCGFCDWAGGREPCLRRGVVIVLAGIIMVGYTLIDQQKCLFDGSPAQVCRRIYDGNPFPESVEVARYIKSNSTDKDTVAVLGSEPQIYFYSGRRAATRYIYMYPLMEIQDFALQMQNEMISEIEAARPKFLIFVEVEASWLVRKDSRKAILKWAGSYIHSFYDVVGVIEIRPNQSICLWNEQARNYTPMTNYSRVVVYKRKQ